MARILTDGHQNEHGRRAWGAGVLVFSLALALRLLFWQATPDASGAYAAYYKGDAPTWVAYAQALRADRPFELGLPLRPPGSGYLLAFLWDGDPEHLATLRFLWCLLGAATVVVIYGAVLRSFGFGIAIITGLLCAASSALMILSTSLNSETPYLLAVAVTLYLWASVRWRPGTLVLIAWAAVQAVACLIRVEHALFFGLLAADLMLAWMWRSGDRRAGFRRISVIFSTFALVLLPWHLRAWSAIRGFNTAALPLDAPAEQAHQQLEASLHGLTWEPGALAARDALPAFCRRTAADFVAATAALRGATRVTAADFNVLTDAFGSRPQPLPAHPFVALYGGLNFYLANNPAARGGFSRAPLERPPPLVGGADRYPRALVRGLPPSQLTLTYPPHLEIINHGYRLGWSWIRHHPQDYLRLAATKLRIFWQGATMGFTGYNVPLGMAGLRRAVDLVAPVGGVGATIWRALLLIVAAVGLYVGRHRKALAPWVLFATSQALVTLAFFGYARLGATVFPVLALLIALAVAHGIRGLAAPDVLAPRAERRWMGVSLAVASLLVAIEAVRWLSGPAIFLDGQHVGRVDPFPVLDYQDRRLEVR